MEKSEQDPSIGQKNKEKKRQRSKKREDYPNGGKQEEEPRYC
jgi:hypothetical protein